MIFAYEVPGPDGKCANSQPKNNCTVNGAIVTICGACPSGVETVNATNGGSGSSGSGGSTNTTSGSTGSTGATSGGSGGTQTTVTQTTTNSQKEYVTEMNNATDHSSTFIELSLTYLVKFV